MKTLACLIPVAVLAAGLGGCATVTRGTTTEFKVSSTPPGAAVESSTGFHCKSTPCSMKVPRKNDFDVTVTKPGYVTKTAHVRSVTAGGGAAGMAGNIVLGGVIGMVVDGSNGSMKDLTPNPLAVTLEPVVVAEAAAVDPATPAAAASKSAAPEPAVAEAQPAPMKP